MKSLTYKDEHAFIRAVNRRLDDAIYCWKINDNFAGGVPDSWYSGAGGDLWIEYKYIKSLPKRSTTKIKTSLTDQQKLWLKRRAGENRVTLFVVGSPEGIMVMNGRDIDSVSEISVADFREKLVSMEQLITIIKSNVL